MAENPQLQIDNVSNEVINSHTNEPQSSLPEIAEYEARSSRMKNMLLAGSKKNKKKDIKTVDPNKLEHTKFQREVEAGYYNPTQEEVDQLVLIPHFENVHFRNFRQFYDSQNDDSQDDLDKPQKIPPGVTPEEYKQIRQKAKLHAKDIYNKCFPSGNMDRRRLFVDESADNLLSLETHHDYYMCGESQDVLVKTILQLNREVEQIESQNKILFAHLQLLDKAKQMLEITAKCSVEAIQWEKQKIQEYYEEIGKEKKSKNQNRSSAENHRHRHQSPKKNTNLSPTQNQS